MPLARRLHLLHVRLPHRRQRACLCDQFLKPARRRYVEKLPGCVPAVLIPIRCIPRQENNDPRRRSDHLVAALDLILPLEDVHRLILPMVYVQRQSAMRRGYFDSERIGTACVLSRDLVRHRRAHDVKVAAFIGLYDS
jgi:hypothetical protein